MIFPAPWATAYRESKNLGRQQSFNVDDVAQWVCEIPAGSFSQGSPSEEAREDGPEEILHEVVLTRGFWLADTACTQALWRAVLGTNPSTFSRDPNHPVEQVSWDLVTQEFLPALNEKRPGLNATLPTEAQWEYACRARTRTPFFFGTAIRTPQVNFDDSDETHALPKDRTVPVREGRANDWGLYQMHGNVWEWCADYYAPYTHKTLRDPTGPGLSDRRVMRGGSYFNVAHRCRSAARRAERPTYHSSHVGFRICLNDPDGLIRADAQK